MTKKKITAPLSYDPGKGRPKEYLAYLNWHEMQALRRINGNNMERGPMGLPSFPPDWAGPGNTQTASGSWQGTSSVNSGSGAGTGGGSDSGTNVGSSGTTTPSSSAPNAAAAAAASKLAEQESADAAARQAAETKAAAEAARNIALSQDAAKGGIRSINVGPQQAPVQIGGGQIAGTIAGMARQYSTVTPTMPGGGGMGQLNARVGSSTVAVGPRSGIDALDNIATGSAFGMSPSRAMRMDSLQADMDRYQLSQRQPKQITDRVPAYNYNEPIGPAAPNPTVLGDQELANRLAELNRLEALPDWQFDENKFKWLGTPSDFYAGQPIQSPTFNKYEALRAYKSPYGPELAAAVGSQIERQLLAEENPSFNKYDALAAYKSPYGPELAAAVGSQIERQLLAEANPSFNKYDALAAYKSPYGPELSAARGSQLENRLLAEAAQQPVRSPVEQARINAMKEQYSLYGEGYNTIAPPPDFETAFGPPEDEVPNQIVERGPPKLGPFRVAASTPIKVTPEQQRRLDLSGQYWGLPESAPQYNASAEDVDRLKGVFADYGIGGLPTEVAGDTVTRDEFGNPIGPETPEGDVVAGGPAKSVNPDEFVGPTYVTPEQQAIINEQERKNRYGIKGMEKIAPGGGIVSGIEKLVKVFTGKDIADFGTDLKNRYMQAGPSERAAMREKYPDMRRFAVSIGDIPPNTGMQYASSGIADIGPERGNKGNFFPPYYTDRYYADVAQNPPRKKRRNTGQTAQYDLWDQGIDIPSPGDPDYNDYQEYLAQKGGSAEV